MSSYIVHMKEEGLEVRPYCWMYLLRIYVFRSDKMTELVSLVCV